MSKRRGRAGISRGRRTFKGSGSDRQALGNPDVEDRLRVEAKADGSWRTRSISGSSATKSYRCPGCDHLIVPATPHMVVWPVTKALLSASAIDERRHWHLACWKRKN